MPQRDSIHNVVRTALEKAGWTITDDPYIISYGERFLFIDLGATGDKLQKNGVFLGVQQENRRIVVEIKEFRGRSVIADLELAIGQYVLYRLLLKKVDPEREIYLAVTATIFDDLFREPLGETVIHDLPLHMIVIDTDKVEITQWI